MFSVLCDRGEHSKLSTLSVIFFCLFTFYMFFIDGFCHNVMVNKDDDTISCEIAGGCIAGFLT